ncbi:hypothetical protein VCRA2116O29_220009 [Vibrio crassostreae]|nr:hypothetical protein VCRA2116O29_220009 [Vibrio crassostreae]
MSTIQTIGVTSPRICSVFTVSMHMASVSCAKISKETKS